MSTRIPTSATRRDAVARSKFVVLTAVVHRDADDWIARCEELGTAVSGRTLPVAMRRLAGAIELHIRALQEVGELDVTLAERGVKVREGPMRAGGVHLDVAGLEPGRFATPVVLDLTEPRASVA
jgi:predicted RNase H-like HicB family nuclease